MMTGGYFPGRYWSEYWSTDYWPDPNASTAVWPLESQVLLGVVYGPTGTEFTGSLTGGGGGAWLRRR